jgi:DNA polymerase III alpha subunit
MADPQRPFVHLDVQTAYSTGGTSPSLPEDFVRALARQHPLHADTPEGQRIYLAIADYGLHSAVKTAVACARAGIEHIPGCACALSRNGVSGRGPSSRASSSCSPWTISAGPTLVLRGI